MSIICKIDNRERDIIQKFDDNIVKENLDIGDIQIIYKDNNDEKLLVIIERKTYDDLSTSIKDGRYKEQKQRIKDSGIKYKIYLIECDSKYDKNISIIQRKTIVSSTLSILIQDINVIKTLFVSILC